MIYVIISILFLVVLFFYILYINSKKIQLFLEDKVWQLQKSDSEYALI